MNVKKVSKYQFNKLIKGRKLVCFGAGELLYVALNELQYEEVLFVCDNNPNKIGTSIEINNSLIPIFAPERIREISSDVVILITTQYYYEEILEQLGKFKEIEKNTVILFSEMPFQVMPSTDEFYEERVVKIGLEWYDKILDYQKVNKDDKTARIRHMKEKMLSVNEEGCHPLIIPGIVYRINSVCNLNCDKCLDLMPFQKKRENFNADRIVEDIINFSNNVDEIIRLDITGGETLLHPDIDRILEAALSCENVYNIGFATNSTIVPKQSTLDLCKDSRVMVSISDYGQIDKMGALVRALEINGISFQIFSSMEWFDCGDLACRNKDEKTLRENFLRCTCSKENKVIAYGRMYACGHAQNFDFMGAKLKDTDYVELDWSLSREEIKKRIRYLYNQDICSVCNHCDMGDEKRKFISPAEQKAIVKSDYTIVNRREYDEMMKELSWRRQYK